MRIKRLETFKLATFNVRGLGALLKQQTLISDLAKLDVDICGLQETHVKEENLKLIIDRTTKELYNLYFAKTSNRYHGVGFAIRKHIPCSIHQIDDRIIVANVVIKNVDSSKDRKLKIINFYAPTSQRTREDPSETERLYNILESELNKGNRTNTFVIGDFNGIIGSGNELYPKVVGSFGKGRLNQNGQFVIDLAVRNNLYASNTQFQHSISKISTFVSNFNLPYRRNPFRNQIDFVLAHSNWKRVNTNARSYINTETDSDHRIVISSFSFDWKKLFFKQSNNKNISISHLRNYTTCEEYKKCVEQNLQKLDVSTNQNTWSSLCDICIKASESLKPKRSKYAHPNSNIEILSEHQKQLRVRINATTNLDKRAALQGIRKSVQKSIKCLIKEGENDKLLKDIEDIELHKDDSRRMFESIKLISRKTPTEIIVQDKNDRKVLNNTQKIEVITDHFSKIFNVEDAKPIGNFPPTPLTNPFSEKEITSAVKSLKNNKSAGCDQLRAEHIKCAPLEIHKHVADLLNSVAATGEHPKELTIGLLTPLAKPGKPKGPPANLRPVILLSLLRKILAICIIRRIDARLKKFAIPATQAAYSTGRSTTELVYTFKLLAEKAITENGYNIHFLMLDMSKAFDTIQRGVLLADLKAFLEPDELHLIKILLENVQLAVKLRNELGKLFVTNIGSPQGDAASALFFIFYLAITLKYWKTSFDNNCTQPTHLQDHIYANLEHSVFTVNQEYADDISWASTSSHVLDQIEQTIPSALKERNLFVNTSKTERFSISDRDNNDWRKCKIVGSYLGTAEDIQNRKKLTNYSYSSLKSIFRSRFVTVETKLRIFGALLESIFLYNSELWTLTKALENEVDVFQRQLLRNILNIRWSADNWLANDDLYAITKQSPWSEKIEIRRIKFFAHATRLKKDTSAQIALKESLRTGKKYQGGQRKTYINCVKQDFQRRGVNNLNIGINLAQDREGFKSILKR